MIEHFQEKVKTVNNFIPQVLQTGMEVVNSSDNNSTTRLCSAVLLGFERLLLVNAISKSESVLLLKFASDRLSLPATHINTHSILGLLVTCMYADISETDENRLDTAELKMEVVSILFDRRGLPQESEVITGILPTLMSDLFSSQDIMNKVIGEFLSEQQPHPVLIAKMVYEVFEEQATVGGSSFLQDWVLLSITSFTQRHPLAMAIWSLTCFFVSVSSNHWLKGLFPYVASRIGCLDEVDEKIFLLSCKDFYDGIRHDSHKSQTFVSVFQSAGRTELIYKTVLEAIAAT
ncbi:hypothetical protein EB796_017425 [Bugula neritina]|uniref:Huntingtin n=1 Tax=Bugula neritina TaxID=10212 RepID=A0A7J7JF83_BUGNE|nr:hypothetical protein EB796_017425 [Bugula neritina]